mgnify:FL=1
MSQLISLLLVDGVLALILGLVSRSNLVPLIPKSV